MMSLVTRWKKMQSKERLRWLAVGVLFVVGVYGLVVYPVTKAGYERAEGLVNRKLDRIKKRTTISENIGESRSAAKLKRELRDIEKALESERQALAELQGRLPLANGQGAQDELVLDLSAAARKTGLRIIRLGGNSKVKADGSPALARHKVSGRPIHKLHAKGSYWQLQAFLQQMEKMSVVSVPVYFQIALPVSTAVAKNRESKVSEPERGLLDINLTLTL